MFSSFSIIPFVTIIHYIFIYISNANPSVDDNMLIGIMKGHPKMQINEYSKQKYESYLGIVYFMRKNWQCDKIAEEFEEYERTECQKYRKYLDILYEYLYREYSGIPTVKPKFVFKNKIEINGPIIYALNCLVRISQFYLNAESERYIYKLNESSNYYFESKLLNEKRLNYEFKFKNESKMPINEMILQLAIETANDWQTNESFEGIIQQNFDKNMEEMLKKAEPKAKKDKPERAYLINDDKHFIILDTKFDDERTWARINIQRKLN